MSEEKAWVNVKERLPDKDGMLVAVYAPNAVLADLWPARWDVANHCFGAGGGWFETDEITHWIPMPEPPSKEVQNA